MLWAALAAFAAPPYVQIDGVVHTRERTFQVPVELTREEETRAAAVRLWASTDAGKTWERKREQSPRKPFIRFAATADGAYDLALAVIGANGRQEPGRPEDLQPGLRIVIDTAAPKLDAEIVEGPEGRRGVQWSADDLCPAKLLRTDVAVFVDGQGWQPGTVDADGKTAWFRAGDRIARAQIHVRDAAGNAATLEVEISGENFRTQAVESFVLTPSAPPAGELQKTFAARGQDLAAAAAVPPARMPAADAAVRPAAFAEPAPRPAPLAAPPPPAEPPTVAPAPPAPAPRPAVQVAPADSGWKPRKKS